MNVTKIIITRYQIFHLKCTKFNFDWAPPQTPLGSSDPLAGFGRVSERKEEGREKGGRIGGEGK